MNEDEYARRRKVKLAALYRQVLDYARIDYWARLDGSGEGWLKIVEHDDRPGLEPGPCAARLTGRCKGHRVTAATVARGFTRIMRDDRVKVSPTIAMTIMMAHRMADTMGGSGSGLDGWTLDEVDCDVLIQVGLFGEIIYG